MGIFCSKTCQQTVSLLLIIIFLAAFNMRMADLYHQFLFDGLKHDGKVLVNLLLPYFPQHHYK